MDTKDSVHRPHKSGAYNYTIHNLLALKIIFCLFFRITTPRLYFFISLKWNILPETNIFTFYFNPFL